MKKVIISIILIVSLVGTIFILSGCSNKNESNQEGASQIQDNKVQLSETFTTNDFEITLTNVQFSKNLYNINKVGSSGPATGDFKKYVNKFLSPMDINNLEESWLKTGSYFTTDSERSSGYGTQKTMLSTSSKVFLTFEYTIKYIGKEQSKSLGSKENFVLDYNDGYTFDVFERYFENGDDWNKTISFQSLSDNVYKVRGYFMVPEEVETNTDAKLVLKLNSYGDKVYNIR